MNGGSLSRTSISEQISSWQRKMIKLTVNGRPVELNDGSTLLDAAREAGVYIPTLCHYPTLPSHAVCRMCLVDVDGESKPQPACVTMANEGDIVETDSRDLQEFRKTNAEWLLARHPNDCMRCEVNGSCKLQRVSGASQEPEEVAAFYLLLSGLGELG